MEAKQMEDNMFAVTPAVRGTSSGVYGKLVSPPTPTKGVGDDVTERALASHFRTGSAGPFSPITFPQVVTRDPHVTDTIEESRYLGSLV